MLVVQLSDPHIDALRPDKAAAFGRAVEHVRTLPMRPDAVLITGDCTDHGRQDEYDVLQSLLAPLDMPVYVVPGNHDDRAAMLERFGHLGTQRLDGFLHYVVDDLPVRLIGLDTQVPGQGGGELCDRRLAWLDARLDEARARPTLLFMHHPPLVSGLDVMDAIGLEGSARLCDLVLQHPHVARVVAGHVHMAVTTTFGNSTLMTCPGTDATFQPDLSHPAQLILQYQPPLALLHTWSEPTGLLSFTHFLDDATWITLHDGQQWAPTEPTAHPAH
ncbi:phosphodiesterase [uncultured Deinococcus sp.]|uniref:phosphodiesterase n=1 Tax=uncultured Deinococcus sp. TaxID=158789 RepID=UPI0025E91968|nr:phosphodiesterase [uncultured Deinococcus sp.]